MCSLTLGSLEYARALEETGLILQERKYVVSGVGEGSWWGLIPGPTAWVRISGASQDR